MGYYTQYRLEIVAQPDMDLLGQDANIYDELTKALTSDDDDINMIDGFIFDVEDGNTFFSTETWKWYSHEEDMRNISKKFQYVLFKLSGQGEDNLDLWVKYFLNGKMQHERAKVTFGEFNPDYLK